MVSPWRPLPGSTKVGQLIQESLRPQKQGEQDWPHLPTQRGHLIQVAAILYESRQVTSAEIMNQAETLEVLFASQDDIEKAALKLLRDAQALKTILKRQPLCPEVSELLAELRRGGDDAKTLATRFGTALIAHADAEFVADQAKRPKWAPSRNASPGQRLRRGMLKGGCLVGNIDAPGAAFEWLRCADWLG